MCIDWWKATFDKSTDHQNNMMVAQFVFPFLARQNNLPKNFNRNGCQNFRCYCKKQINKNVPWSVLLSNIEMMPKWFPLSFENYDVISMDDCSTDHGKLLLIC